MVKLSTLVKYKLCHVSLPFEHFQLQNTSLVESLLKFVPIKAAQNCVFSAVMKLSKIVYQSANVVNKKIIYGAYATLHALLFCIVSKQMLASLF